MPLALALPPPVHLHRPRRRRARFSTTLRKRLTIRPGGVPCIVRRERRAARTSLLSFEKRRNAAVSVEERMGRRIASRRRRETVRPVSFIPCPCPLNFDNLISLLAHFPPNLAPLNLIYTPFTPLCSVIACSAQSPGPSTQVTPVPKGRMKSSQNLSAQREAAAAGATSPDWVLTSPRSFGSMKDGKVCHARITERQVFTPRLHLQPAKSSVRAKTSAFLGKMLGAGSTRDRSVSSSIHCCGQLECASSEVLHDAHWCPRCATLS